MGYPEKWYKRQGAYPEPHHREKFGSHSLKSDARSRIGAGPDEVHNHENPDIPRFLCHRFTLSSWKIIRTASHNSRLTLS